MQLITLADSFSKICCAESRLRVFRVCRTVSQGLVTLSVQGALSLALNHGFATTGRAGQL